MATQAQIQMIAEQFGFSARRVPLGWFLAPVSKDRFGNRHTGDDSVLIKSDGTIVPYADDSQAVYAASVIANHLHIVAEDAEHNARLGPNAEQQLRSFANGIKY